MYCEVGHIVLSNISLIKQNVSWAYPSDSMIPAVTNTQAY